MCQKGSVGLRVVVFVGRSEKGGKRRTTQQQQKSNKK